jgi:predicted nucleic acid-binding protein
MKLFALDANVLLALGWPNHPFHHRTIACPLSRHNQVNDAFLISLALSHGASVLTFDAPLRHLPPKPELVELIT